MERHRAQPTNGSTPSPQAMGIGQALRQAFSDGDGPDEWAQLLKQLEHC